MQLNIKNLIRAGLVCLLLTSVGFAGPLSLETDVTTGLPGWHSSTIINNGINLAKISATIEYAVYAPGMFDQSVALGGAVDPSLDSDYVYAYEIFSVSVAPLSSLTISTVAGAIPLSYVGTNHVDNWSAPNGGLLPSAQTFIAGVSVTNARWTFNPQIPLTTGYSDILFFTSPFGPQFNNASISGGGSQIFSGTLPSPMVPEPTTLTIAAIAVAFLLAAGRLRRRAA